MIRRSLVVLPLLLLAACGGKSDGANASANAADAAASTPAATAASAPAATAAAGETKLAPGEWLTNTEVVSFEIPGMPPEAARQAMAHKNSASACLTAEQAARPNSDFFARSDAQSNCHSENFSMTGGRMSATLVCSATAPGGGEMRMDVAGSYLPTSYDITSTMTGRGPSGQMKIVAHTTGQRTGECTAAPAAPAGKVG